MTECAAVLTLGFDTYTTVSSASVTELRRKVNGVLKLGPSSSSSDKKRFWKDYNSKRQQQDSSSAPSTTQTVSQTTNSLSDPSTAQTVSQTTSNKTKAPTASRRTREGIIASYQPHYQSALNKLRVNLDATKAKLTIHECAAILSVGFGTYTSVSSNKVSVLRGSVDAVLKDRPPSSSEQNQFWKDYNSKRQKQDSSSTPSTTASMDTVAGGSAIADDDGEIEG